MSGTTRTFIASASAVAMPGEIRIKLTPAPIFAAVEILNRAGHVIERIPIPHGKDVNFNMRHGCTFRLVSESRP